MQFSAAKPVSWLAASTTSQRHEFPTPTLSHFCTSQTGVRVALVPMSRPGADQSGLLSTSDRAPTSLGAISRAVSSFSNLSAGLSRLRIGIDMGSGRDSHHSHAEGPSARAEQGQSSDGTAASDSTASQAHSGPTNLESTPSQPDVGATSPTEALNPPTYQSLEPVRTFVASLWPPDANTH